MRAGYERHAERPGLRLRLRSDRQTGAASGLVSDHVPVFGHGFEPHHAGKVPDDLLGEPISPPSPTQFDSSLRKTLTLSDILQDCAGWSAQPERLWLIIAVSCIITPITITVFRKWIEPINADGSPMQMGDTNTSELEAGEQKGDSVLLVEASPI